MWEGRTGEEERGREERGRGVGGERRIGGEEER